MQFLDKSNSLQQYLPFTVLKLTFLPNSSGISTVATVLTVYGIETETVEGIIKDANRLQQYLPFTVLKHG